MNASSWTYVFPVHPRTRHVLDAHAIELGPNVRAVEPLGYLEMLALVAGAGRVVTDSGGLQKEAYWLRVPVRDAAGEHRVGRHRAAGANTLVDPADPSGLEAALDAARFPADAPQLYGDGHASERIAALLAG